MKKTYISILATSLLLTGVSVFADERGKDDVLIPNSPVISSVFHVNERSDDLKRESWYKNSASTSTLNIKLQKKAEQLIKERINSLQSNLTILNADKSLTSEQKAILGAKINSNITGLTTLKTSIATSATASSTKELIDSIYSNFRIYGIVIPEVRLERRVYDLQNHATKLTSELFVKVQTKIDEAKSKGKDVTVWQKSLDDSKALVAADTAKLSTLLPTLTALKPSDYGTTSKSVIENVNAVLKSVSKDFNSIAKNLHRPSNMKNMSQKWNGSSTTPVSLLSGTSWTWVSTLDNGTTTVATTNKFVLTFGEGKHVKSTTDCNQIMGVYSASTGTLSLSQLISTKMFCDGSQESVYAQALSKVTGYSINGSSLTLSFSGGVMNFNKKN